MNCPYLASLFSLMLLCFADEEEKMCPGGRRWCEDPVSYPDHVVTSLVNSSHPLWRDLAQPEHQPRHHKHHQRHFFPLDKSSQPACQTNEYYIVPRATRNNKEQWRFILNTGDDNPRYKQVVKVGECQHTDHCRGYWPGHVTQCRQLYLQHRLVAITREGEVLRDSFLFPSCCSCHVLNLSVK